MEKETSIDNGKQEEESITSDRSMWDNDLRLFHVVSKDEGEVNEEGIITLTGKKKMISKDFQGEEDLRFISLIAKFLKLIINDYSQIRGEGLKHPSS